jgi:thiol-disulfide isomerase/thioredoxin
MLARVGQRAPNLHISEWVQGVPTNLDREKDKIVLVEVFQVNCPGCFLYGIPSAIDIYNEYADDGVRVLGLATAFEDYDKNTPDNLRMLAETGEVVGETRTALSQYSQLDHDRLKYKIPFPLAMDRVVRSNGEVSQEKIMDFITAQIPDFDSHSPENRQQVIQKVRDYMGAKEYTAETFEMYALQGTPSTILVDREGVLRDVSFGQSANLRHAIQKLLAE